MGQILFLDKNKIGLIIFLSTKNNELELALLFLQMHIQLFSLGTPWNTFHVSAFPLLPSSTLPTPLFSQVSIAIITKFHIANSALLTANQATRERCKNIYLKIS